MLQATASAGHMVGGRYRLLERAGSGGMAEVWRARDELEADRDKCVAIKRMLAHKAAVDADFSALFRDEARVTGTFRHPNIVGFIEAGEGDDGPYMVLEWVDGASLKEVISNRPLEFESVFAIAHDVLVALEAIHQGSACPPRSNRQPVIHRDLSPCNILVGENGSSKLADFGLARSLGHARTNRAGMVRGKPTYLPPEVLLGRPHGIRADLYGLGVVLWEALAGREPFADITDPKERVGALLHRDRPGIRTICPTLEPSFAQLLDRVLSVSPERRFRSATEMLNALSCDDQLLQHGRDALSQRIRKQRETLSSVDHDLEYASRVRSIGNRASLAQL